MIKFAYNNIINASTYPISFELNCSYYSYVFIGDEIIFCLKFDLANELAKELRDLILIYQQNLFYIQGLQKQVYHKEIKLKSYTSDKKVKLNSKYIKTK